MRLFAPDLYRNFGIGFVAGALAIGATAIEDWQNIDTDIVPMARAAEAPQPSSEFLIRDESVKIAE
ncbi:MAG: hypothetical protein AAF941_09375 [Pseudomonadota bacterium]